MNSSPFFVFWRHSYKYRSCAVPTTNAPTTRRKEPLLSRRLILSSAFRPRRHDDRRTSGAGVAILATAASAMMLTASCWTLCCKHNDRSGENDSWTISPWSNSASSSSSSSSSPILPWQHQRRREVATGSFFACPTCGIDDQRPLLRRTILSFCVDTFLALTTRIINQYHHHGFLNHHHDNACRCEALSAQSTVETSNASKNSNSHNTRDDGEKWNIANTSLYERMPLPDRALLSSHVVYGQLLQKDLVESYTVYRLLFKEADTTAAAAAAPAPPNVVAAISLGKSLNGHDGIVHGGILALLIDDVLGFGYVAVLDDDDTVAVTANLTIDFRTPCPESSDIVIAAYLLQRQGRKLVWKVRVTSPDQKILYCEATSVYVILQEKQQQ
jgi:uncharacterized protein (TIGR00369 family)